MQTFCYHIRRLIPLSDTLVQVFAYPSAGAAIEYQAGQYVNIIVNGEARPFSIANAPLGGDELEFHIRHTKSNHFAQTLLRAMKSQSELTISAPYGRMTLQTDSIAPIVMCAGGTGIAPMKALLEAIFADSVPRSVDLYWGAKTFSELYLHELLTSWDAHIPSFHYHPILEEADPAWLGGKGTLLAFLAAEKINFSSYEAYVAGPYALVSSLAGLLSQSGLMNDKFFSDML